MKLKKSKNCSTKTRRLQSSKKQSKSIQNYIVLSDDEKAYSRQLIFSDNQEKVRDIIIGGKASTTLCEELKFCLESLDMQHVKLKKAELNITNQKIHVD